MGKPTPAAGKQHEPADFRQARQEPEACTEPGDRVVYTATKHSRHPGPRAEAGAAGAARRGLLVRCKKYWLVREVRPDGTLTVITRRGKERIVAGRRPRLRPARWWETFFFGSRFPQNRDGSPDASDNRDARVAAGT